MLVRRSLLVAHRLEWVLPDPDVRLLLCLHQVLLGATQLLLVLPWLTFASFLLLTGQEEHALSRRGQNILVLVRRGGGVPWLLVAVMLVVRVVLLVRVRALHLNRVRLAHLVGGLGAASIRLLVYFFDRHQFDKAGALF